MEDLSLNLYDLPDEILIFILRKLDDVEVLYSLTGVNKRLTAIAHDPIFTSHLTLYFLDKFIKPIPDPMLDRFCSQILPQIHLKIEWLNLEAISMERILRATNYPYLYGLGLYGVSVEQAISLAENTAFTPVVKHQILSLFIDISKDKNILEIDDNKTIFKHIFTMFTNLQYLNFGPSLMSHQQFSFNTPSPNVISSNLLELHITVVSFIDVLYLLDGRFNQLRTFHVKVYRIQSRSSNIHSEEKLPNLRCFSLYSDMLVHFYDESIPPLLHRMLNLEQLDLHLKLHHYKVFIDGNDLKKDIINYMPRLNKFTFNIRVIKNFPKQMNFPSNEDIQRTFNDFKDQIISYVNLFQECRYSYCHIYTCPYRMKYYDNITNNFPGGLFNYVYKVSLFDERPFEYDFFCQIARSFPFMKELTVTNKKPQKNKLYKKSKNDNQDLSIIKYLHMTKLNLYEVHYDYVEQFLVDTEVYFPDKLHLSLYYKDLKMVTENFSRDATRINCAKVCSLWLRGEYAVAEELKNYFPQTKIFLSL